MAPCRNSSVATPERVLRSAEAMSTSRISTPKPGIKGRVSSWRVSPDEVIRRSSSAQSVRRKRPVSRHTCCAAPRVASLPLDRLFTTYPGAMNKASIFAFVERRTTMQRASIVPHKDIADLPLMAVDELVLRSELHQLPDQLPVNPVGFGISTMPFGVVVESPQSALRPSAGCLRTSG